MNRPLAPLAPLASLALLALLIVLSFFSSSAFSINGSASLRPADSISSGQFDVQMGLVFESNTVMCKYNDVAYSAVVLKNRDIDVYGTYGFILTDTLAITIDNKAKKLWLFKYKGMNKDKVVFRTNGFLRGKLEIGINVIRGFMAFPKEW